MFGHVSCICTSGGTQYTGLLNEMLSGVENGISYDSITDCYI